MRLLITAVAAAALLSGCSNLPVVTAGANTTISKAQSDVQEAIALYGIAKGIAQAAELAQPSITPIVTAATAALDPLVAQAQAALNAATTDANALEALAAAIKSQTNTLTVQAAPSVIVSPSPLASTVLVPAPAAK